MTHTKTPDWSELKRLAEALSGREWYVLGPPWAGFTETFTVLRGSPDPHVGVAILETVPNEEADETDDHYEQEALAKWLQHADPNAFLQLIAENAALKAQVAEERDWQNEIRKVCKEAMGGNTTFIDDDVARAITALTAQRDEMAEALAALEPQKPADDPKDGPCCHEQNEDGLWIGTGCTCQNYGDAQSAALWADAMNRWIEWNNITQNLGEKPMTNATEITARDAALLFRNPSHFDELLSAFEASEETDTAGKLDDALKAIARRARTALNKEKTDG